MENKELNQAKHSYIINHAISPETKICRYMEFDAFLQILEKQFYVPRKLSFLDSRESGRIPMLYRFAFGSVPTNDTEKQMQQINQQQEK